MRLSGDPRILSVIMVKTNILSNHFLVAMPQLNDFTFTKAVIYVSQHDAKGALGIIINRPLALTLGKVLEHLNIEIAQPQIANHPVLMGGPIGQEHGFIVYEQESPQGAEILLSASKDMLDDIAKNKGPDDFLITLGYAGWEAGQLENEIARNDWLVVPFNRKILFETPLKSRWQKASTIIGVEINQLSGQIGHA
ncbi:YqgE/AlgH family protein [Coxiella burnetii]|uniref:YqgE/AlgH family protein n=1 Tax=Coxiella burnetii TaxID=777 RepID=UPI00398D4282